MKKSHIFMAVLVSFFWGINAPIVKMSLAHTPLFFLCFLRSFLLAFLILLFPKTNYPKSIVGFFALAHGVKIVALYTSITVGLAVGLSTLILQTQSIFVVLLAFFLFREKISSRQYLGLFCSFLGVILIGHQALYQGNTPLGLGLGFCAALASSISMLLVRDYKKVTFKSALSFVGWFNLFSVPPFFVLSLVVDGSDCWQNPTWIYNPTLLILLILGSLTVIGAYGLLSIILAKNETSKVAGFLLLTPVFGFFGSYVCLSEIYTAISILGTFIVIGGLAINQGVSLRPFLKG